MSIITRADTFRLKSLAPSSPPSRPLRAASGGGLRPALTAAAGVRNGPPSERKSCHERFALHTKHQEQTMP
jgi:hypothetical protein